MAGPPARVSLRDSSWKGQHKGHLIPVLGAAMTLFIVFLADMSWLFGATFHQQERAHALNVLVVDLDGGVIGEAITNTYQSMKSASFPTLDFQSASQRYDGPTAVREAVCRGDYWGAIYTHAGASDQLASAVSGGSASADYAPNDTVTYIYNSARYSTISDSLIGSNLRALISASREGYYQTDEGTRALSNLDRSDEAAVRAFLNPFQPTSELIATTMQGSRNYYNTLNIVFPIILTFFFLLPLNAIGAAKGLPLRLRRRDYWLLRFIQSKIFTFLASLIITSYTWAFREDWDVPTHVFATNWMITWFLVEINWQVMDSLIGSFLPFQFAPIFLITWVILNVTSTAFPFEIAPGFYRIGYMFPAYNVYTLQVQAWSGCANQLHIALPILFTWWVLGHIAVVFSVRKRCADAAKQAQQGSEKSAQNESTEEGSTKEA